MALVQVEGSLTLASPRPHQVRVLPLKGANPLTCGGFMRTRLLPLSIPLLLLAMAACSDSTTGAVSLALTTVRPLGVPLGSAPAGIVRAPQVTTAGDSTVIVLAIDTITLRNVELVLRKIELKAVEDAACDTIADNDDCEEFETGPVLVSLPLGTTATEPMIRVSAPPGQYDKLEFKIHKPGDSGDPAFMPAHPDFNGVSIRVTGTYSQAGTRSALVFTSDLDAEQEVELRPPLTVSAGAGTDVTLRVDVATWFLNAGGTALVAPAPRNTGQPNEGGVGDRIEASFDAFRDEDHDGHDDDHEGEGS